MTSVAVVIPFRSDDPERIEIMAWCVRRWGALTDYPILVQRDDADGPFNRSRAVNLGVARAEADVVIVADADTAVRDGQAQALAESLDFVPWAIGYSRWVHLGPAATTEAVGSSPDVQLPGNPQGLSVRYQSWDSVCGLWAMRTEDYYHIGGNDERFAGWGWEDTAFAMKADTLLGPAHRLTGVGLHLFHALRPDRKSDHSARANLDLWERYEKANGDPDAMTALVRESLAAG